jgi:tRNA nucleotidyltransferase (CCA-adding enzyme)
MYYAIEKSKLSLYKKHYGPPLDNEKHLQAFKKAWKSYKIEQEGNKAYVIISRQYTKPELLVKALIKTKEHKQLASSVKIV